MSHQKRLFETKRRTASLFDYSLSWSKKKRHKRKPYWIIHGIFFSFFLLVLVFAFACSMFGLLKLFYFPWKNKERERVRERERDKVNVSHYTVCVFSVYCFIIIFFRGTFEVEDRPQQRPDTCHHHWEINYTPNTNVQLHRRLIFFV